MEKPVYRRILIKLSGESLQGRGSKNLDLDFLAVICDEINAVVALGVQVGIVVGGGNILRGIDASSKGIERTSADYMGMLATVINSLALQNVLESKGIQTRVQSAIEMREISEPFIVRKAVRHLEKGRVVIFAAGTGNPYFSTDTAAALRAMEIGADVIMKATKVDGVYDKDPLIHGDAKMFTNISYTDVLSSNLKVMDSTSVSLCRDNNLPIIVFNLEGRGNIKRIVLGQKIGTHVGG